jgi:hypothetical protein
MLKLFLLLNILLFQLCTSVSLRRLGQHSTPSTEFVDIIHQKKFNLSTLQHYQENNYPLIIRHAVKHWPACAHWNNSNALLQRLGPNKTIRVELSSKEDPTRAYTAPETWLESSKNIKIQEFVQEYGKKGWYSAIDLPQALFKDISIPQPLHQLLSSSSKIKHKSTKSGETILQQQTFEELKLIPRLWWSKGGTRSSLHYDPYDNLHCMVSGSKTFVLFPPRHISRTHVSDSAYFNDINQNQNDGKEQEGGNNNYEFYTNREVSLVDVDAVDLDQFPGFVNASFSVVNIHKGDCLFLPYFWMHSVRSIRSNSNSSILKGNGDPRPIPPKNKRIPNIAVSFWWDSWTSLLGLEWIGGLSDPKVSISGDYIVGDTERLFLEFDNARRKRINQGKKLPNDHALFSYAVASGQSLTSLTTRSKNIGNKRIQQQQQTTFSKIAITAVNRAAKESSKLLSPSYRWPKFIPVFMKSGFRKSSILRKYPVKDQQAAATALMWVYPELPKLIKLIRLHSRNQSINKGGGPAGALAISSTNLWLERQMNLLLGNIRGTFAATRRLRKRQEQSLKLQKIQVPTLVATKFQIAVDVLQIMKELADVLMRGNVARILSSNYPVAKSSISHFERNCGKGTTTTAIRKYRGKEKRTARSKRNKYDSMVLSRTKLNNNVVCGCVQTSGLFQQKALRTAIVSGTSAQLGGLLWSALSSDFDCLVKYVLETLGETRSREAVHTAISFKAFADNLPPTHTLAATTATTSTVFDRAMAMNSTNSAAVKRILKLDVRTSETNKSKNDNDNDNENHGSDSSIKGRMRPMGKLSDEMSVADKKGTKAPSSDGDVVGHIETKQVNYDGGWNMEQHQIPVKMQSLNGMEDLYHWSDRCDVTVLSSWSKETIHRYYQSGTPVLLLNAISKWDTTLRYLFTRESIADNLWEDIVYPSILPNEDALLFECDGPACYRSEDVSGDTSSNGSVGSVGSDSDGSGSKRNRWWEKFTKITTNDNTGNIGNQEKKDKSCKRSSQTMAEYLSNCFVEEDTDGWVVDEIESSSVGTTKSQIIDVVPTHIADLVNDAERLLFGKEKSDAADDAAKNKNKRSPPIMHYIGPRGSGDAVTYNHANDWNALLYGRKRWYMHRPMDAFSTRTPILEYLNRQKNEKERRAELICEQPSNSILLIPEGWSRGNLHVTDCVGVSAELSYEPL